MDLFAEHPIKNRVIFDSIVPSAEHPYLISYTHDNVSYSFAIWIRENKRYDTTLIVYPVTNKPQKLKYIISHWFIFVNPSHVEFEETIDINNPGTSVSIPHNDSLPNFFFFIPAGASLSSITAEHDFQFLPARLREKTIRDHYGTIYPLRPGITKMIIRYSIPRTSDTIQIKHRWHYLIDNCNLLIQPANVIFSDSAWSVINDDALYRNNYRLYRPKSENGITAAEFKLINPTSSLYKSDNTVQIQDNVIQNYSFLIIISLLTSVIVLILILTKMENKKTNNRRNLPG